MHPRHSHSQDYETNSDKCKSISFALEMKDKAETHLELSEDSEKHYLILSKTKRENPVLQLGYKLKATSINEYEGFPQDKAQTHLESTDRYKTQNFQTQSGVEQ